MDSKFLNILLLICAIIFLLFVIHSFQDDGMKIDAVSEESAVQGFDKSYDEAVQGFEDEEEF